MSPASTPPAGPQPDREPRQRPGPKPSREPVVGIRPARRPMSRRGALLLGGLGAAATAAGAAGLWWSLASRSSARTAPGPGAKLLGPPELRSAAAG